jgi:hypothetical protein
MKMDLVTNKNNVMTCRTRCFEFGDVPRKTNDLNLEKACCYRCSFRFILKAGVEGSIVIVPRITDQ